MNPPSTTVERPHRTALAALAIAIACAIGVYAAATSYRDWARNRDRLLAELEQAGVVSAEVFERIEHEPVTHHAQLAAARALVFQMLEAPPIKTLPADEQAAARARRLGQLARAHTLSRAALALQPNSWEASMLQGASTYLTWSLVRDRRLFTRADAWQEPLIKAWREAPSQGEPRRILGTAYLELWPVLSPQKKRFASTLLRDTFAEDPSAFERMGPSWLDTVEDVDRALAIVPDAPRAWAVAARFFAAKRRWRRYRQAYLSGFDSLQRALESRLAEGEERLALGDIYHSRTRFARVIGDAPPDRRFVPIVDHALAVYPAGLQRAGTGDAMIRWLRWTLRLAASGIAGLTPASVNRLAGVVPELTPSEAAMAALIGGDLRLAERMERLESLHTTATWAPYLIAKADRLLALGDAPAAAASLAGVGVVHREHPRYWLVQRALANARDQPFERAEAERHLNNLRARWWPAASWRQDAAGDSTASAWLEMLPATGTDALSVRVAAAPETGCVVRLRLDGATVLVAAIRGAGQTLVAQAPLSSTPHVLEWTTLAGKQATPGRVSIERRTPASDQGVR